MYYDEEYKDEDADIETCFPVRKGSPSEGITIHKLGGGPCVSLIHKGPYEELGRSYDRLLAYIKEKKYQPAGPMREHYLKGPGMIFKGNPANYLTEIQFMLNKSTATCKAGGLPAAPGCLPWRACTGGRQEKTPIGLFYNCQLLLVRP